MEVIAWPMAILAVLFALTPAGVAIGAVNALKNRVPNTLNLCLSSTFISWTFTGLFALMLPYGDIPVSASRFIGISIAAAFGAAFVVVSATVIPFIEEDESDTADGYQPDWAE